MLNEILLSHEKGGYISIYDTDGFQTQRDKSDRKRQVLLSEFSYVESKIVQPIKTNKQTKQQIIKWWLSGNSSRQKTEDV